MSNLRIWDLGAKPPGRPRSRTVLSSVRRFILSPNDIGICHTGRICPLLTFMTGFKGTCNIQEDTSWDRDRAHRIIASNDKSRIAILSRGQDWKLSAWRLFVRGQIEKDKRNFPCITLLISNNAVAYCELDVWIAAATSVIQRKFYRIQEQLY